MVVGGGRGKGKGVEEVGMVVVLRLNGDRRKGREGND